MSAGALGLRAYFDRYDGVDAGGLDESWRQQPGTPVTQHLTRAR
jgi:predicted dinucleotide-binding enzyme